MRKYIIITGVVGLIGLAFVLSDFKSSVMSKGIDRERLQGVCPGAGGSLKSGNENGSEGNNGTGASCCGKGNQCCNRR